MKSISGIVFMILTLIVPTISEAKIISGKVTFANGEPAVHAHVSVLVDNKPKNDTQTDNTGNYSLKIFTEGQLKVWATYFLWIEDEDKILHIVVKNTKVVEFMGGDKVDIVFSPDGSVTLSGKISYPAGEGGEVAEIEVMKKDKTFGRSTFSKKDGTYEITGLSPGDYDIFAFGRAGQLVETSISLKENEKILDLKLQPYQKRTP